MFYNHNVIYGAAVAGQQKPPRRRARGGRRRRRKNRTPTPGPYAITLVPGAPPCQQYQNARTGSIRGAPPPPPAYPPPDEGSPEAEAAAAYAASQAYYYGGDPQAFYEPARPDRYHTQYVTRSDGAAFTFKETSANIPATPRQLHRSESSFRRAPVSPVSSPRGTGRFRVRAGAYDQIYDARAASSIGDGDDDDDSDEEEDDVARLIEALSGLDASERAQRTVSKSKFSRVCLMAWRPTRRFSI